MCIQIIGQLAVEFVWTTLPEGLQPQFALLPVTSSECYDAVTLGRSGTTPHDLHHVDVYQIPVVFFTPTWPITIICVWHAC